MLESSVAFVQVCEVWTFRKVPEPRAIEPQAPSAVIVPHSAICHPASTPPTQTLQPLCARAVHILIAPHVNIFNRAGLLL
jgi:hypothetical protein